MTTTPARTGRALLGGLAAGAAGTTALNAVTHLDVVVRARSASSTPEDTAAKLAEELGIEIPGDEDERANRLAGLGPLGAPGRVELGQLLVHHVVLALALDEVHPRDSLIAGEAVHRGGEPVGDVGQWRGRGDR